MPRSLVEGTLVINRHRKNEAIKDEECDKDAKSDNYSMGASLNQSDIQTLVVKSLESFGVSSHLRYLVLMLENVLVKKFCQNVCGTHFFTFPSNVTSDQMLPYAWIGNLAKQCPEIYAWSYAPESFVVCTPSLNLL
ncbi:hypothetical protein R1flu_019801 [Riccia fluitans]|uniref:DNA-directed RNA polymerase n=1 Tax=Riccia fluitans TaxID=41844 RepID=A0ABD1ZJP0_9MARC